MLVRARVKVTRRVVEQAVIEVETTEDDAKDYAAEEAVWWGPGYQWTEVPATAQVLHTRLLTVERQVTGEPAWKPEAVQGSQRGADQQAEAGTG